MTDRARGDDEALGRVLKAFGVGPDAILGRGGEARVYALDAVRVLRIYHPRTDVTSVSARAALLAEVAAASEAVPFAIPEVLDTAVVAGRVATVERRLPGRPLESVLDESSGAARERIVRAYLDAADGIGEIAIDRDDFGDLCRPDAIRSRSFRDYLRERAARSLADAGPDFVSIDPAELAVDLPEPASNSLVHLDAFPGNMLADGERVTAVLDFGAVCLVGDRRLDPLAAAAYLTPLITDTATSRDREVAAQWLEERGLAPLYEPARRWLAAFWSFAHDDLTLQRWCRGVLLAR